MKLILCNDDFGISYGLTDAVAECHRQGLTTCAAVRVDGVAFEYAVQEIWPEIPDLELGLHLNLTETQPIAELERVPDLVDEQGFFKRSFVGWLREAVFFSGSVRLRSLLQQIEVEFREQFKRYLGCVGSPDFVNGNQHIHMIPGIFELVCRLTHEFGGRYVRWPSEPFFLPKQWADYVHSMKHLNPLKHFLLRALGRTAQEYSSHYGLTFIGSFVGILNTGRMNPLLVSSAVEAMERRGIHTSEVLFHPALIEHEADRPHRGTIPDYYFSSDRAYERDQLLSAEFQGVLERHQIELTTHRALEN